jgi:2-phospho-L-lactate guanylyltransferase
MRSARPQIWVVVLIKGFETAKQRLSPALDAAGRERLAKQNARLALAAAGAGDAVLAVCGSQDAAELARLAGAETLLERGPEGQNPAARRGIEHAVRRGAGAVLLLSSDLPLVSRRAVAGMIAFSRRLQSPAAVAAPASGRGGTNALYLAPPDALRLHFGDDSLARFEAEAAGRRVEFRLYRSRALALDLDEPADLATLEAS